MWEMHPKEFDSVLALPDVRRYAYFIKRVADWQSIWSLKGPSGWVLYGDNDGNEVVPVWPHPQFAKACAKEEWKDTIPESIDIHDWIDRWIPGLIQDRRSVAVFPLPDNKGVKVSPERLKGDLERELEKLE